MSFNVQSHTISQRKSLKLNGTKTSVTKNQILISTGIVSLDAVLGKYTAFSCSMRGLNDFVISMFADGGLPIGTVALVGMLYM